MDFLLLVHKKLSAHRCSSVFKKAVNPKDAPGYDLKIRFPMDLSLVRKMIISDTMTNLKDLRRCIGLLCHNCVKFNGKDSDYAEFTRDFEAFVDVCFFEAGEKAGENLRAGGGGGIEMVGENGITLEGGDEDEEEGEGREDEREEGGSGEDEGEGVEADEDDDEDEGEEEESTKPARARQTPASGAGGNKRTASPKEATARKSSRKR
jgi:hypothetical protein